MGVRDGIRVTAGIHCGSTCNMREKNAGTGNTVWVQGQSVQAIKLFQVRRKLIFLSIVDKLLSSYWTLV